MAHSKKPQSSSRNSGRQGRQVQRSSSSEETSSILGVDIPESGLMGLSWSTIAISAAAAGIAALAYTAYRRGSLFGIDADMLAAPFRSLTGSGNEASPRQKFTKLTKSSDDFRGAY